jgi:proline iminopeptidase
VRRRVAYERETTVVLGGHPHFVYAGGASDSSVLLLCHGGPGYSELPMIRAGAYSRLQEHVLLVTWDQRGTGRSYSDAIAPEVLTVGRLLDDAIELLDWVRNSFERDKLHLLGHSWGGCLALLLAHRRPQALASVYALCPFVNLHRSAAVAYAAMIGRAQSQGDHAALIERRDLGAPPYADLRSAMAVHTKWIIEYGGMILGGAERAGELFGRFENVPGYSASDYENAAKGQSFSGEHLIAECAMLDLSTLVRALEVPLTIGVGRHDLVNATEVTLAWFEGVRTPSKRLHMFEQSAHFPNFCEPEAFQSSVAESIAA